MRFKDMLRDGIGKDAPGRRPKPFQDDTIAIGDYVRAQIEGKRTVAGRVVAASRNDTCWVLLTSRGRVDYHKVHCVKARAAEIGKTTRKAREEHGPLFVPEDIYGDGDV